jgi:hypothetical protein
MFASILKASTHPANNNASSMHVSWNAIRMILAA